jgi:hypothetical protein
VHRQDIDLALGESAVNFVDQCGVSGDEGNIVIADEALHGAGCQDKRNLSLFGVGDGT